MKEKAKRLSSASYSAPLRGVFWVKDDKLLPYPFREDSSPKVGVAKSGRTFNHRKLWNDLSLGNEPYNYYPRGRVDISNRGEAVIFLNPNINTQPIVSAICIEFGIQGNSFKIVPDYSDHYKCYLDAGWYPV